MEKKKRNKKKNEVSEIPYGSLEGLGSTFLAYLDPPNENQGLELRDIKWEIMAVQ